MEESEGMNQDGAVHLTQLFDHCRWANRAIESGLTAGAAPKAALREYAHIVAVEELWLSRVEGREPRCPVWPRVTLDRAMELRKSVTAKFSALLAAHEGGRLAETVRYANSEGREFDNRVYEILLQVVLHGMYHRGKVNQILRTAGRTPVPVDFIGFARGAPTAVTDLERCAATEDTSILLASSDGFSREVEANDQTALLVIDVQKGSFCIPGVEIHQPEKFLLRVSALIEDARCHSVPVIYSQFCGPPGAPMSPGAPGHDIHPAVTPNQGDVVVPKDDSDAFLRSDLESVLHRLKVRRLIVCGMQSEFCVDATCRTAHGLGYEVVLVQDAHATADSASLKARDIEDHVNTTLGRAYVTLSQTDGVFDSPGG